MVGVNGWIVQNKHADIQKKSFIPKLFVETIRVGHCAIQFFLNLESNSQFDNNKLI